MFGFQQEYGAIVDIKTIANNSTLLHGNNSEVKLNVDPTETSPISSIGNVTYKQIFCEAGKFINKNNNLKNIINTYLEYPKLYLQCKQPEYNDNQEHCQQCYNDITWTSIYFMLHKTKGDCTSTTMTMCMTDSLTTTTAKSFIINETLIEDSNGYKLQSNWLLKVFIFK